MALGRGSSKLRFPLRVNHRLHHRNEPDWFSEGEQPPPPPPPATYGPALVSNPKSNPARGAPCRRTNATTTRPYKDRGRERCLQPQGRPPPFKTLRSPGSHRARRSFRWSPLAPAKPPPPRPRAASRPRTCACRSPASPPSTHGGREWRNCPPLTHR